MDKDGHYLTKQPEYETVWALGGNCEIDDLDAIAMLDRLCDDYGLDTIEMGATIGVAMEAGLAKFGDSQASINLLKEVGKGTPLGVSWAMGQRSPERCSAWRECRSSRARPSRLMIPGASRASG